MNKELKKLQRKKEKYRDKILKLSKIPVKKVAYHFNCPDGLISAALVRYLFSDMELTYIPFDYALFKDEELMNEIADENWFAIVDLEPFNTQNSEYFFDHHISNEGKDIRSNKIHFVSGAPSTAHLIEKAFSSSIPNHLVELVRISEITDTASYNIPAPFDLPISLDGFSWDEKIWFVEDVCKSTYSIEEHDELLELLAFEGLKGLWKSNIIYRVKRLRQSRKDALDIAHKLRISDFIVLVDKPLHYNIAFISHEIQKRGATGIAYLTVYPDEVKVSLRLNKQLSSEDVDRYRVDLLAQRMSGGGHKGASGAETDDLESTLEQIESWTKEKGLQIAIYDLREK
ncbi:MAG: hypothetical protein ACXABK_03515 [Candidatus Heimdallarchaeaceae archaeon]|jgi:hypothetical protein